MPATRLSISAHFASPGSTARHENARPRPVLQQLRGDLFAAVPTNDAEKIAAAARRILSVIYIDMDAQKLLRQACTILKDQACADRHHFVEFGLLKSIVTSGDGKSCETGWQAVSIDEEYFVLRRCRTLSAIVNP